MPLYEYKCESCGKRFEVIQKFSDEPLTKHEECGGGPVERLISPPAFHFKGSGWYVTDYAKSSGSSPAPEAKSESSSKSESDSKPAESKPAEAKPAPASSTTETK